MNNFNMLSNNHIHWTNTNFKVHNTNVDIGTKKFRSTLVPTIIKIRNAFQCINLYKLATIWLGFLHLFTAVPEKLCNFKVQFIQWEFVPDFLHPIPRTAESTRRNCCHRTSGLAAYKCCVIVQRCEFLSNCPTSIESEWNGAATIRFYLVDILPKIKSIF